MSQEFSPNDLATNRCDFNITIQQKGGVGKSYVAFCLTSYYYDNFSKDIKCYDMDNNNASFSAFHTFGVDHFVNGYNNETLPLKFEDLIDNIIHDDAQKSIFIDCGVGASESAYMQLFRGRKLFDIIEKNFNRVLIHIPICGGTDAEHCCKNALDMLKEFVDMTKELSEIYDRNDIQFSKVKFVVWENPRKGSVHYQGKNFNEILKKQYPELTIRYIPMPIIPIPFSTEFENMRKAGLAFADLENPEIINKIRQGEYAQYSLNPISILNCRKQVRKAIYQVLSDVYQALD